MLANPRFDFGFSIAIPLVDGEPYQNSQACQYII